MDHLPEPAIELWHKVLPLGLIFFCASFNLTILQVRKDIGGRAAAQPRTSSTDHVQAVAKLVQVNTPAADLAAQS
jgi:hypothetical protein